MIRINSVMFSWMTDEIKIEGLSKRLKKHCDKYIESIHQIDDFIISSTDHEEVINREFVFRTYGDRTGFEASCNEELFSEKVLVKNSMNVLALLRYLSSEIKKKYPADVFDFYITQCDDEVNFRFHKSRSSETSWLRTNIDEYNEGVIHLIQ